MQYSHPSPGQIAAKHQRVVELTSSSLLPDRRQLARDFSFFLIYMRLHLQLHAHIHPSTQFSSSFASKTTLVRMTDAQAAQSLSPSELHLYHSLAFYVCPAHSAVKSPFTLKRHGADKLQSKLQDLRSASPYGQGHCRRPPGRQMELQR